MKKSKRIRFLGSVALSLSLISGSLLGFTGCTPQNEKSPNSQKEIVDYETPYLEYVSDHVEYFSRGMILCDLNDDEVPELFSISYEPEGDRLLYHEFKDGKVSPKHKVTSYINLNNLIHSTTYFEDTRNFFGIYENKATGQKVLINSVMENDISSLFDIITFEEKELALTSKSEDVTENGNSKRDEIMSQYEVSKELPVTSYLLRGEFGGEYGIDPAATLKGIIEEFKSEKAPTEYAPVTDGEFDCYIQDINLTNNEMVLVPAAYITLEEYTKAKENNELLTINGEETSLQYDEVLATEQGIAHLYQLPWFSYSFEIPTEEHPKSLLNDYLGNTPMKVKMSENTKIRYGVLGTYNEDGTPTGYETLGRKQEYTVSEYLPHYAEYNMGSYYRAIIKNNEVVSIDVMYHP